MLDLQHPTMDPNSQSQAMQPRTVDDLESLSVILQAIDTVRIRRRKLESCGKIVGFSNVSVMQSPLLLKEMRSPRLDMPPPDRLLATPQQSQSLAPKLDCLVAMLPRPPILVEHRLYCMGPLEGRARP